jgi:hypothetical protein
MNNINQKLAKPEAALSSEKKPRSETSYNKPLPLPPVKRQRPPSAEAKELTVGGGYGNSRVNWVVKEEQEQLARAAQAALQKRQKQQKQQKPSDGKPNIPTPKKP